MDTEGFITYPEGNEGHDLMVCVSCGHLYAVNVGRMLYVGPPLDEKVASLRCVECVQPLSATLKPYPEFYVDKHGIVLRHERSQLLPPDDQSLVWGIDQLY